MAPSNPELLPALSMLALARMNLNDWSAAGTLFEELYGKHAVLAPYHAYYAARCRLRRGDVAGILAGASHQDITLDILFTQQKLVRNVLEGGDHLYVFANDLFGFLRGGACSGHLDFG
jgi:hypothetical protein